MYIELVELKQKYPHLKVKQSCHCEFYLMFILQVIFSLFYGALLKHNPDNCVDFVKNMTDFLLRYDFDGLDITFGVDLTEFV